MSQRAWEQQKRYYGTEPRRVTQLDKPPPAECQCEHICHTDREKRSPNGNPGHSYGVVFYTLVEAKTPVGTFFVCPDCAGDCYAEFAPKPQPELQSGARDGLHRFERIEAFDKKWEQEEEADRKWLDEESRRR